MDNIDINRFTFKQALRPIAANWGRKIAARYKASPEAIEELLNAKLDRVFDAAPKDVQNGTPLGQLVYVKKKDFFKDNPEFADLRILDKYAKHPLLMGI